MGNSMIPVSELTTSQYANDDIFKDVARTVGFLPRLQLFGAISAAVQEGKIGVGRWGLVPSKDVVNDLGPSINVFALGWRPKAMQLSEGKNPVSYFDTGSPEFQEIKEKSGQQNSGCMYGPEFLLYIPDSKKFCTYYMMNKTARNVASDLLTLYKAGRPATLTIRLISGKTFKWHGPVINACSTPLDPPNMSDVKDQLDAFNSPEKVEVDTDFVPDERER